jgi:hypothetical protein
VDRHRFNTAPDPNFHFFYADQDPTSCFTQLGETVEIFFIFMNSSAPNIAKLEKIYFYSQQ